MKFRRRRSPDVSVDLTPLIDVVFLLLIFFMVTTTFVDESGLTLELPEATAGQTAGREPISLRVARDGAYTVAGRTVPEADVKSLMAAIRGAAEGRTATPLTISADARAPHQAVVTAMDAAARAGFDRVTIATTAADREAPE